MHSAVLKKVKYPETLNNEVRNIYGWDYLYKIGPKFQIQDIRRISVRILFRRALVITVWGYGLYCSRTN
jgi:hypothetical protein